MYKCHEQRAAKYKDKMRKYNEVLGAQEKHNSLGQCKYQWELQIMYCGSIS